jgi:hypothetical protein
MLDQQQTTSIEQTQPCLQVFLVSFGKLSLFIGKSVRSAKQE